MNICRFSMHARATIMLASTVITARDWNIESQANSCGTGHVVRCLVKQPLAESHMTYVSYGNEHPDTFCRGVNYGIVVFLEGWFANSTSWPTQVLHELCKMGYALLFPGSRTFRESVIDDARIVHCAVESAVKLHAECRGNVVGVARSYGGFVAQEWFKIVREQVPPTYTLSKLILFSTGAPLHFADSKRLRHELDVPHPYEPSTLRQQRHALSRLTTSFADIEHACRKFVSFHSSHSQQEAVATRRFIVARLGLCRGHIQTLHQYFDLRGNVSLPLSKSMTTEDIFRSQRVSETNEHFPVLSAISQLLRALEWITGIQYDFAHGAYGDAAHYPHDGQRARPSIWIVTGDHDPLFDQLHAGFLHRQCFLKHFGLPETSVQSIVVKGVSSHDLYPLLSDDVISRLFKS